MRMHSDFVKMDQVSVICCLKTCSVREQNILYTYAAQRILANFYSTSNTVKTHLFAIYYWFPKSPQPRVNRVLVKRAILEYSSVQYI